MPVTVHKCHGRASKKSRWAFSIHSLSTRLIAAFCLIMTLIIGSTSTIHYHNMRSSLFDALDSKAESKLNSLSPLCASYFANFETDLIEQLGNSVQSEEEITYVVITGADGEEYFRDDETIRVEGARIYERDIVANEEQFGTIQIGLSTHSLHAELRKGLFYSFGSGVFSLLIGVAVSFYLARSITRPLVKMSDMLEDIAHGAGDLTQRLDESAKNELGTLAHWFNKFVVKLQTIIGQAGESINQFALSAEKVAMIADKTNHKLNDEQGEIEQVAAAMSQMIGSVEDVNRNAADTAQLTTSALKEAEQGQIMVASAKQAIGFLAQKVESATDVIRKQGEECEKIGGILGIIQGVADQTNLLALNAAIEAARAGEQGRGFAVVADEVRTLATRTQQSTHEITEMIGRLQAGAHQSIEAMVEGHVQVKESVERASDASKSLSSIIELSQKISQSGTQIAHTTEKQSYVAEGINHNVVSIKDIGRHTASGSQQTTKASEELSQLAEELRILMAQFKVL